MNHTTPDNIFHSKAKPLLFTLFSNSGQSKIELCTLATFVSTTASTFFITSVITFVLSITMMSMPTTSIIIAVTIIKISL